MDILVRYLSNGAGPLRTHKAELTKGYGELEAAMDLVGFEATVSCASGIIQTDRQTDRQTDSFIIIKTLRMYRKLSNIYQSFITKQIITH